ncbi:hypothetical protein V1477_008884 [Vespula maculifrons]|uniref:Uncharacterized protein n=1 Tax=Vespula maculifrons TaxID=7453 RepID=A0ABD2CF09_VESMC
MKTLRKRDESDEKLLTNKHGDLYDVYKTIGPTSIIAMTTILSWIYICRRVLRSSYRKKTRVYEMSRTYQRASTKSEIRPVRTATCLTFNQHQPVTRRFTLRRRNMQPV